MDPNALKLAGKFHTYMTKTIIHTKIMLEGVRAL